MHDTSDDFFHEFMWRKRIKKTSSEIFYAIFFIKIYKTLEIIPNPEKKKKKTVGRI